MNATELQKIVDWLIDGARSTSSPTQMMAEICERLVEAGLPLWRVGVFVRTLHPDIFGRNFIWRPGAEVTTATAGFDVIDSPEYINNPLAIVFGHGARSDAASTIPKASVSRFSTRCVRKASPITSRCRCFSSTARLTHRAGPRSGLTALPMASWRP